MLTRAKVQSVFKEALFNISDVVYMRNDLNHESPLVIHSRSFIESITGSGVFSYYCIDTKDQRYSLSEHLLISKESVIE